MNRLRIALHYAAADLFARPRRGRLWIGLAQIAFLVGVVLALVAASGSLRAYLFARADDPVINRVRVYDSRRGTLQAGTLRELQSLRWGELPGQGRGVYPREALEAAGADVGDAPFLGVAARITLGCEVRSGRGFARAVLSTAPLDDPMLARLDLRRHFSRADQAGAVINRRVLEMLGLPPDASELPCANLKQSLPIVAVHEDNLLSLDGVILEGAWRNYLARYHPGGSSTPVISHAVVYPRTHGDVLPLNAAVVGMGLNPEEGLAVVIEDASRQTRFASIAARSLVAVLILLVGSVVFLAQNYELEMKRPQIGMLRAYGLGRLGVLIIFITEGLIGAALGACLGLGLFLAGLSPARALAASWAPGFRYSLAEAEHLGLVLVACFIAVSAGAFLAVWRALRSDPAELLRE